MLSLSKKHAIHGKGQGESVKDLFQSFDDLIRRPIIITMCEITLSTHVMSLVFRVHIPVSSPSQPTHKDADKTATALNLAQWASAKRH